LQKVSLACEGYKQVRYFGYFVLWLQGAEAEELIAAARQEEMVTFYMTSNADVARVFDLEKLKKPTAVLLKKEHEQRAVFGKFNQH
jgi:protein disulfide-isomerase A1